MLTLVCRAKNLAHGLFEEEEKAFPLTFPGTKRPSMTMPSTGTWRGRPHGIGGYRRRASSMHTCK